ncbi:MULTISPECIES: rhodanese-like domain-containing protein [Paenibacillus]|uniref:Rhodanese-like domain-containing protein n=1 Tax=Paenibacillus tianjinensis TaxID=2810347 RepID=A0ABX7L5L4_9BACL|nr:MULTISPECIES: rhodanese-like domain-containing protein [Paenibacillus]MDF9839576.1 rhodanese-related sulfurtransferase [Paenibacillus sp. PastF-2]MDF9846157.1 rhodanese-related sulfurtransferase [Paenibacillus sp. PastM-2]MDF9852729.1 rhodanese-related sulfurtransferase [Paenibacillus sp. PastF-1]MDH6373159.1 rhodanese-related sulfurtransferase [Paenibacillus sp. PastF-3]MDH6477541.1 rhodanese-related sulfurtransferase [Paenibacillus sp. PastH-2]
MIIFYIASLLVLWWILIQLLPVPFLTCVNRKEWSLLEDRWSKAKLLDVRDTNEYREGHIPGSINISVGRLPVVWKKDLSAEDEVIIFSHNWLQRKKAARILARRGFTRLYAVKDCFLPLNRERECYEYDCR